jgi:methionine-rich copper-binding protein CopC
MAHSPMPMKARISAGNDPKTMLVTPLDPLPVGTYKVEWRAVSSDTHPITGNVMFKVK